LYLVQLKTAVPGMLFTNCLLPVNGCIVNPNIAPLGFTMRLFTANLRKQLAADRLSRTGNLKSKVSKCKL